MIIRLEFHCVKVDSTNRQGIILEWESAKNVPILCRVIKKTVYWNGRLLKSSLHTDFIIPDLWQQEAVRHLVDGKDVVLHAPTGAGKTYIFELLVEQGLRKRAIYTVPTRALANDKLMEWRARGWDVGICTGDIVENERASVVVATLETQKRQFLQGKGPRLLVIDEYQMLADPVRGVNYELAIAMSPRTCQILLMSGSVSNPQDLVAWLNRLDRDAVLVRRLRRPVPQEEVLVEGLKIRVPARVRGFWPRIVSKALVANLGPLIIFAPHRNEAENIARQLSREIPVDEELLLTPEQRRLAGRGLARLLKNRISYHHSGLNYLQRAGVIEPLAKAGQLRVVVATMGLASGINFSMRSVLVAETLYRVGHRLMRVRPDELLQMFGRAGRRGRDRQGYILVVPDKPRIHMASPLKLHRVSQVDWPSLIGVMQAAHGQGNDPLKTVRQLTHRLFSLERIPLGLEKFMRNRERNLAMEAGRKDARKSRLIEEVRNSKGIWERKKPAVKARLGDILFFRNGNWIPALSDPRTLKMAGMGVVCLLQKSPGKIYGREVALANWSKEEGRKDIVLTKWLRKQVTLLKPKGKGRNPVSRFWYYDPFEEVVLPRIPEMTGGGKLVEVIDRKGTLYGRIDFSDTEVFAIRDSAGKFLLGAPKRRRAVDDIGSFSALVREQESGDMGGLSPTQAWFRLGLIDGDGRPTRRGAIFSFFHYGEGLAVAAALEEPSYEVDELVYDLANLRAGHRFEDFESFSSRLGNCCRLVYGNATFEGYLDKGLPLDYGDGAAEVIARYEAYEESGLKSGEGSLQDGDIERVRLEWVSLLRNIVLAPDFAWGRWRSLQSEAEKLLRSRVIDPVLHQVPELSPAQRKRREHRLRF